ncbi:MAG: hypothetical protein FJ125_09755 [Deltaproteobacteria bacterium]|nr:hypothetical protein [Deltaproteobacteria bacterium]
MNGRSPAPPWWDDALFDTCSLITVDKVLAIEPVLAAHFSRQRCLEANLSGDQLRPDAAARVRQRATLVELPPLTELARHLGSPHQPSSCSRVDRLVYASSRHYCIPVVTADRQLALALAREGLLAGNITCALRDLVLARYLSETRVVELLRALVAAREHLLPDSASPIWEALRTYSFP